MPETATETKKYVCKMCGYIYNPYMGDKKGNIPPGVSFEDLPGDWVCPLCGGKKTPFSPMLD